MAANLLNGLHTISSSDPGVTWNSIKMTSPTSTMLLDKPLSILAYHLAKWYMTINSIVMTAKESESLKKSQIHPQNKTTPTSWSLSWKTVASDGFVLSDPWGPQNPRKNHVVRQRLHNIVVLAQWKHHIIRAHIQNTRIFTQYQWNFCASKNNSLP